MAAISKRAQARNEKELHELLRLPGNSQCADCDARNPSWASWNLGVFLCMRCASIHRKLGTHISKVKSLSMDTWSSDQVESMKTKGNNEVNKEYNPKNKKPDIPLDADEVDGAMERFIRKKYQEKSLVDGRPEPPSRSEVSPQMNHSPQASPTMQLPPKKHKFFGFGLRASSDKKHPKNEPRVDSAFRIGSDSYESSSERKRDLPDHELQVKLAQLRDMGFTDNDRNIVVLKKHGGDVERAIATLVKLGPSEPARRSPEATGLDRSTTANTTSQFTPNPASPSNNPWGQPLEQTAGLSFSTPQHQQPSNNPWQAAVGNQESGLEQQFQNLQVSNPLFPHSTGGYSTQSHMQPNPRLQTMTPPIRSSSQQYGYSASPTTLNNTNPFYQTPLSTQSTGSNPFLNQGLTQPAFAPSFNPFFNAPASPSQQTQVNTASAAMTNPFGLPPQQSQASNTSPMAQFQSQNMNPFGVPQQQQYGIHHAQTFPPAGTTMPPAQSPPPMPNSQYSQPQQNQQGIANPYYNNVQMIPQQQFQPLAQQQTGRYTKTDIMALFNHPQLAPQQQPLASIPEPPAEASGPQQYQSLSPAPTNNPYGGINAGVQRSATMPVTPSTMHSAGGGGSRNPFMTNQSSRQSSSASANPTMFSQPQSQTSSYPQGPRHASNESVSVNNPNLMDGRHSPDAFASLSARYVR